ncbi:hypothetical protein ACP4OV_031832 [Aristida adscensionis]
MASPEGRASAGPFKIPAFPAGGGRPVPAVGLGTASHPFAAEVAAALTAALELGYRHLDTAAVYGSERLVGEAVAEAVRRGVVASREEVFVTTKMWCTQCHPDLVLPSLRESLQEEIVPMDLGGVWKAMEECHRLGLAKMIGVSNFTTKKLQELLAVAKLPPAVNQVELNPCWQQRKLIEFCKDKAQVSLRWIYEQGASMVTKSTKRERLMENIEIFDWELSDEDQFKISQIPQQKYVFSGWNTLPRRHIQRGYFRG